MAAPRFLLLLSAPPCYSPFRINPGPSSPFPAEMKSKRRLKTLAENCLFVPTSRIVRVLPRKNALHLGRWLGTLSGRLLSSNRRVAAENMRRAFPHMPEEEIQRKLDAMFVHLGQSAMEMLRLDLLSEKDIQEIFALSGVENLRQAYALGRGVILLSGHVGFWEVGAFLLPKLGFPVDFVTKRMKNPYADAYFTRMREAAGGTCIDSVQGARKIVRSLSQNRGVAVLIDQHRSPREAVPVPFFGRPAYTTPIIARIAMKYQVPVVPLFAYRRDSFRYDVQIRPMVLLKDEPEATVEGNTAFLTSIIEDAIRQDVTQWLWLHRRWRSA